MFNKVNSNRSLKHRNFINLDFKKLFDLLVIIYGNTFQRASQD
jgi:hypothetical protein